MKKEKAGEFQRCYSASGAWATLFQKSLAYRGTLLARDTRNAGRYIIIDSWADLDSFQAFRRQFAKDYEQIDQMAEEYTEEERSLGVFEVV